MNPRLRELFRFVERGLLLAMGSIATGAWGLILARLLSDIHPLFELTTHMSLHVFVACLIVLLLEFFFFALRNRSMNAGPRWKRRLVFTLVPVLFFCWVTNPWRLLPLKGAETHADSIKVLSWNMLLVNHELQGVIDLIQHEQPDVIALVEMSPMAAEKLDVLNKEYPHRMLLPNWQGSGIGVLSRLPNSNFRAVYPANTWMPAIELEIDRENHAGSLSMLAVHAVSPHIGDGSRTVFRDAQLVELGKWSSKKANAAMIIGDLNVTPWSPPFWRLLEEGNLVDSSWYRGFFPSWPSMLGRFGIPIDYALVNDNIKVLDRRNVYHSSPSDHFPIVITIR